MARHADNAASRRTLCRRCGLGIDHPPSCRTARERHSRKYLVKLIAGCYAELGEHLAKVILHSAGTDEKPRTDLGVGQSVARQPGDLRFLWSQLVAAVRSEEHTS